MSVTSPQLELARALRGTFVRFHHESPVSRGHLVTAVTDSGLVEVRGFVGHFSPYLFVKVDRPHSAAEGNC